MTEKECYAILELEDGVSLAVVKRAYRRLAFSLHPDLNPGLSGASRRFQRLNEAYVTLTHLYDEKAHKAAAHAASQASEKQRKEAEKAYSKANEQQRKAHAHKNPSAPGPAPETGKEGQPRPEGVIKDILNDPFARRVFEDIYSRIHQDDKRRHTTGVDAETVQARPHKVPPQSPHRTVPKAEQRPGGPSMVGKFKNWMRRQIDDEQVLHLPGSQIQPGARVRLQIAHGLSGDPQTVEITLPPDFGPGKTMRLRGLGKRIGTWSGDLYVKIEADNR